ncbi:PREDICTED: uncharacterized protein LOC108608648 [Drosophila arizonae]|uniref:Uncharacterized protein LOC108608648 n=1 Tax=Drosophila arizonae TaxID=7263 RepID=A0ABM1NKX0_DROAR|nr:PREDICTED: uncharacterized protein LOC108608648 [Drosophila arizonae]
MSFNDEDGEPSERRVVEEEEKPAPSWVAWCERNSQPIKRNLPREPRYLTRWQKPGPMRKKEWKQFFAWALEKAMPKELPIVEVPIPCAPKYLPCAREPKKPDPEALAEKMEQLSKPLERKMTPKYVKEKPFYPYSPVIVWGQPAKHDKGRPFPPPFIPCFFSNDELEDDFWAEMRFPVRPAALKARPSPRILSLAKPQVKPQNPPHCPIPKRTPDPLDVPPPKRKKFTPQGWRLHQIRLIYLSKPVSRPEFEYFYM